MALDYVEIAGERQALVTGRSPLVDFPVGDLPEFFWDEAELRMQDPETFDDLHAMAEAGGDFYKAAHMAVLAASDIELGDDSSVREAIDMGIRTYEIASGFATGNKNYSGSIAVELAIHNSTCALIRNVQNNRDFTDRLDYAYRFLCSDAPQLVEVVGEVAGKHLKHGKVGMTFALKAAAVMRGMHILVTREVAAAELTAEG